MSSDSSGEGGERNLRGMSFGGAGPEGAASFGEVTEAYLRGISLGPAEDSFGGGSGFGEEGAISSSYMSRISNVELSGLPGIV